MATEQTTGNRVAIIGAGVAGLTAIKSCLEENLQPICYERYDKLGGLWNYSDDPRPGQGAGLYKSVVTNVSKEMLTFSDYPFPKDYTPFIAHPKVLKHLQGYASHFGLDKYIKFNTSVANIEKNKDGKYWKVTLRNEDDSVKEEYFDYVMVCIGMFNKPFMPSYPGLDEFPGIKMHASQYRDGSKFGDKRVVVVGGSHTAAEVSCEIARSGAEVYLSLRNGAYISPRLSGDLPWDMTLFTRSNFNKSPTEFAALLEEKLKTHIVDTKMFGLQSKQSILATKSFMINNEIHDRIAQGQLTPVDDIIEVEGCNFKLKDGSVLENIDAVVFATGYDYSIPVIDQSCLYGDDDKLNLYKYMFPVKLDDPSRVAMIGLMSLGAAAWPVVELQSRWACRVFAKKAALPDKMCMMKDLESNCNYYGTSYKLIFPHPYQEELAEFLGIKPSQELLESDPKLSYAFEYGPMVPYWYRLQGPGAWPGAKDAILNVWENTTYPRKRCRQNVAK